MIAVTAGEPAGIGPDLCVLLAQQPPAANIVIIADQTLLAQRAQALRLPWHSLPWDAERSTWKRNALPVMHVPLAAPVTAGALDSANAVYVLKTLEARGLLARHGHPEDKRLVLVELTAAGKRLMTRLFPRFNAEEAFVVQPLTPRQRAALADSLRTITTHVESAGDDRQAGVRANAAAATRRRTQPGS